MKPYTKTYLIFFKYSYDDRGVTDFAPCEICETSRVADVHHIEARQAGGSKDPEKDKIENLMGLCRKCHTDYGDITDYKPLLKKIHSIRMNGVKHRAAVGAYVPLSKS